MKLRFIGFYSFLVVFSGLFFNSCETEFSLNGDYRITPVVFGLLDHTDSVHMIKITKAYLGDGDNLVYAQNPDSNYFNSVEAYVTEYIDGTETRFWLLTDTTINNKDTSGVFYGPEQKLYTFFANDLNPEAEYKLEADLNEGQHTISAETSMIDGFDVTGAVNLSNFKVTFNKSEPSVPSDYLSWTFSVNEAKNASQYNYKYVFNWTEYYLDGTNQAFSMERNNGTKNQEKPSSPSSQTASFSGQDFFEWIGQQIPDDPNVDFRRMTGIDIKISIAHEYLAQYMAIAEPVTGIAQSNPEYTNIEGGLGLFASRQIFRKNGFRLVTVSMDELCTGQYTATKKFCSQYSEHFAEPWYCF